LRFGRQQLQLDREFHRGIIRTENVRNKGQSGTISE
jgi:hypothetical protein